MLNFFEKIIDFFAYLIDLVNFVVMGMKNAFDTLLTSVTQTITISYRMPYFISLSFFILLFVAVINYILGRNNG